MSFIKHLLYYEKKKDGTEVPLSDIWINFTNCTFRYQNYTDFPIATPFGFKKNPTFKDLEAFVESRCFPRTRANCQEILDYFGILEYDPFVIIKYNGGNCLEDNYYLKYVD